ncbi:MAG TPA: hypothetical protein DCZ95_01170, partial [Verrucomicrobia bacterium]|nr:hypothetical protein [Verrucomicrobiota bacterium]
MDIYTTADVGGGYHVYCNANTEWMEYTIHAAASGIYDLTLRVATPYADRKARIWIDGVDVSGIVSLPRTGSWTVYQDAVVEGVSLTAGRHVMRVESVNYLFYLNYVHFSSQAGADVNLKLSSESIAFSDATVELGEEVVVTTRVFNAGSTLAQNVSVALQIDGVTATNGLIPSIAAGASEAIAFAFHFTNDALHVITAAADADGAISETDETDNRASRLLAVGNPGIGARLVVRASVPGIQAPGNSFVLTGSASYEIPCGAMTNTYPVEGAWVSVSIDESYIYEGAHTDVEGRFGQQAGAPLEKGVYRATVSVTDQSLIGEDVVVLMVGDQPLPVQWHDIKLSSCDGLLFTNTMNVSATYPVNVTVWNEGSLSASNVIVTLYDGARSVSSLQIERISANASTNVIFNYTASSNEGCRVIRAVASGCGEERNPFNNEATKAVRVGATTSSVSIVITNLTSPETAYIGALSHVSARAAYCFELDGVHVIMPVAGANVQVAIQGGQTYSGARSDCFGNAAQSFCAPAAPGRYGLSLIVDDCSDVVTIVPAESAVDVLSLPDDVWVYSSDIHFGEAAIDELGQTPTNYPFQMAVVLHYALDGVRTVPFAVRDLYTDQNSNLISTILCSGVRTFTNSGVETVSLGYTGVVEGAHIVQVDMDSSFGSPNNDEATRALQVGPPQPLLVVNIRRPANGEILYPDACPVRMAVADEHGQIQHPEDLLRLDLSITPQFGAGGALLTLVENGACANSAYFTNGNFYITWMPSSLLDGRVTLRATAVAADSHGQDENYVILKPKPVDLEITKDDLSFSPDRPQTNETVSISSVVRNTGSSSVSNVVVRFYANDSQLGSDQVIESLAGGSSAVVTIATLFSSAEALVIRVVADPDNGIAEIDEDNNAATKLMMVGESGLGARLVVRSAAPGRNCPGSRLDVGGWAFYEIPVGALTNTYPVEGAEVSVQIATGTVYATQHTDRNGGFTQGMVVPAEEGLYRLYVRVTDDSLVGQEELALIADTNSCGGPALWFDLEARACDGLVLSTNQYALGALGSAQVTVWNRGNTAASQVQVNLLDMGTPVAGARIDSVAAQSSESIEIYFETAGDDNAFHVLTAEIAAQDGDVNPYNNAASKVIAVGAPEGSATLAVSGLNVPSPLRIGQAAQVRGRANYELVQQGSTTYLAAAAASVSVEIRGAGTNHTALTDTLGNGVQGIWAPMVTGVYEVVMTADDCSGWVAQRGAEGVLNVLPIPDDVWTFSQDISFEGVIDETAQAPTNYPFEVTVALHHALNGARTFPVVIRDWVADDDSNLISQVVYSNVLTFVGSGTQGIQFDYTGVVAGTHILEVDMQAGFGVSANDKATRALQIGPPKPLLAVNIQEPANGEVMTPDPAVVRVLVVNELGRVQQPADLAWLIVRITPPQGESEEIRVVEDRNLSGGAYYAGGEFSILWDAPDAWKGRVEIEATAVAMNSSHGKDMNYITLIPRPVDVALSSADITFSSANPAVGENASITARVHNKGADPVTNVLVRFMANGSQIGSDQFIEWLPGGGFSDAMVETAFTEAAVTLIRVETDPLNAIVEVDEANNNATRLWVIGHPGVGGRLVVNANVPGTSCGAQMRSITGSAYYEIPMGAVTSFYLVEGAAVSVAIEGVANYDGTHTDTQGSFSQQVQTPSVIGAYRTYVTVNDESLVGQDEVMLIVNDCTPPEPVVDLELRSCDGLMVATNSLLPGESMAVTVRVWNKGGRAVSNVVVKLLDFDSQVASGTIPSIPAQGVSSVVLNYTAPASGDSYRILKATAFVQANESNPYNNAATKAIRVGSPNGSVDISLENVTSPETLYAGASAQATGRAYYRLIVEGEAASIPVAGATVSVDVRDVHIYSGAKSDLLGNAAQGFNAPGQTGAYVVAMSVNDCSGIASVLETERALNVLPLPDDVWVYSSDIVYGDDVVEDTAQTPTNYPIDIAVMLHHSVNGARTVPVVVRDLYMDALSNLVSDVLYSNLVTFTASGVQPISLGYTGQVAGAHIIEVELSASFGAANNDKATRALQVGPPEPLLVVNIMQPANGEIMMPDPNLIRIRVQDEAGVLQHATDLTRLELSIVPETGTANGQTLLLVDQGVLVNGAFEASGEFRIVWNPAKQLLGRISLRAFALAHNGSHGEDANLITMIPKPVDLEITADDIAFSTNRPAEGETVAISARVHNQGLDSLSNVVVRFYANNVQIGADQTISSVAGGQCATAEVYVSFTNQGARVIRAVIDPLNEISESNELNNDATRILTVGDMLQDARIVIVNASVLSPVCPGAAGVVSGKAEYEITDEGQAVRYDVKGAQVSVQVGAGAVYATAKTGPSGLFQQSMIAAQTEGLTLLTIVVTDESISGVRQLIQQTDSSVCGGGGTPAPTIDLSVVSCDDFSLSHYAMNVDEDVVADVIVRNRGNVTVGPVTARLYDNGIAVATGHIEYVAAFTSQSVQISFRPMLPNAAHHVLSAEIVPVPGEQNVYNNQADVVATVGDPTGTARVVVTDLVMQQTNYLRQTVVAYAKVRYEADGWSVSQPAAGAKVAAWLNSSPVVSGFADRNGQIALGFTAPSNTGDYTVSIRPVDCSGQLQVVEATGNLHVIGLPNEVWVAAHNIRFEGAIDQDPHVTTDTVFRIYAELNHAISSATNCEFVLSDTYSDCQLGSFVTNTLLATNLWLEGSGVKVVSMMYTARVQAAHIVGVDLQAGFGSTANDHATRILQVGDVRSDLEVHILAPQTNNTVLQVPYPVEVEVRNAEAALPPADLDLLSFEFSRYPDYQETITLVENGELVAGAYADGHYAYSYDPQTLNTNLIRFVVRANASECRSGSAQIQFSLCPDVVAPELVVPDDLEVGCPLQTAPGVAGYATASDDQDPMPLVTNTDAIVDYECSGRYVLLRTWTAMDNCGNSAQRVQRIAVNDTNAPVFVNLSGVVTVACHSAVQSLSVTTADDCGLAPALQLVETTNAGACVNSYELFRTWIASDACGNSATGLQTVVVRDENSPVLYGVPSSITVSYAAETPAEPSVTAVDNCEGSIPVLLVETTNDGSCAYSYVLNRTWTAVDSCGNSTQDSQTITFVDNLAPVLSGVPASVDIGCHDSVPEAPVVIATDNFATNVAVIFNESGQASCGQFLVRTWRATDSCNNSTTAVQRIRVVDSESPVLVGVPGDAVIDSSAFSIFVVTAIDNCDTNVSVTYSSARSGNCPTVMTQKWVAVDDCGNSTMGSRVLTVHDATAPVLTCPANSTVHCLSSVPAPVPASLSCVDWSPATVSFVGAVTNNGSGLKGDPLVITRTYRAEDACGNVSECSHTITVEDRQAPILSGMPTNQTIVCGELPAPANVTATDCGSPVSVVMTETTNGLNPVVFTRTWKAWDESGNTNTASQQISVTYCDSIAGQVNYDGILTGRIWLIVGSSENDWSTNVGAVLEQPGVYNVPNMAFPAQYWIRAYRDSNGNESNDYWESAGAYPSNPLWLTNSATGINMTLLDNPESRDDDTLADGWEYHFFGDLSAQENDDPDGDGFSNIQEYHGHSSPIDPTSRPGQIAFFKMDETSWTGVSNEVADSSLYGNHGVSLGGASTTQDLWGVHGVFGGTNYVDVANSESLQVVGDLTISFWMKMTNNPNGGCFLAKNGG